MLRTLALTLIFAAPLPLLSSAAFANELVPLPIKDIQQIRQGSAMQIVVTIDFQACKYNYKGLYVDQVFSGQGQARYHVMALASERQPAECVDDKTEPRADSALVPLTTERYDFIAIQPK